MTGKWPKLNCEHCHQWAERLTVALSRVGGLTNGIRIVKAERDLYKNMWEAICLLIDSAPDDMGVVTIKALKMRRKEIEEHENDKKM